MGRKTWDSLSNKPLPNRRNIVISRNISKCCEDGTEFTTLENVIPVLENVEESEKIFVIGGGQIYKELLPYCDTLYLTKIFGDFKADTFFPYINEKNGWKATEWSNVEFDGSLPYQFVTYKRKQ
jgi:dihydrofolate reductase